jgi:hypothetical protein
MNPNTLVFTKKEFLDNLKELIKDDEIILSTQNIIGSIELKKKHKVVPFAFLAEAFKEKEGIGDIAFNKVWPFAFCICDKSLVSNEVKQLMKGTKKPAKS